MKYDYTPLVELPAPGHGNRIFAKLEYELPSGSHYDRLFARLLPELERDGAICNRTTTLVETTSGSAGISCAFYARTMRYPCIIFVPYSLPDERVAPMLNYGAQVIRSFDPDEWDTLEEEDAEREKATGPRALALTVGKMQKFLHEHPECTDGMRHYYCPNHSRIPTAPQAFSAIAVEALLQQRSGFHCFIGAAGNGTTLCGIGEVLRAANPHTRLFGFEPEEAPVASSMMRGETLTRGDPHCFHSLYGTGGVDVEFPYLMYAARHLLDEVWCVAHREWENAAKELAELGFAVGHTSAAAYHLAKTFCKRYTHKTVLIIFYDRADRYPAIKE